jgi:hypothetical protein
MDTVWELRFMDGRGASVYTAIDVSEDVGQVGVVRIVPIAADVSQERALSDARRCFETGRVLELVAHMGAVAYAVRHTAPPNA